MEKKESYTPDTKDEEEDGWKILESLAKPMPPILLTGPGVDATEPRVSVTIDDKYLDTDNRHNGSHFMTEEENEEYERLCQTNLIDAVKYLREKWAEHVDRDFIQSFRCIHWVSNSERGLEQIDEMLADGKHEKEISTQAYSNGEELMTKKRWLNAKVGLLIDGTVNLASNADIQTNQWNGVIVEEDDDRKRRKYTEHANRLMTNADNCFSPYEFVIGDWTAKAIVADSDAITPELEAVSEKYGVPIVATDSNTLFREEASKTALSALNKLKKWEDGLDSATLVPKPFDIDLWDYREKDREVLLHNTAEISKLNDRILFISELTPSQLERLYRADDTSDSDKSIIACIEALRWSPGEWINCYERMPNLIKSIENATEGVYGFEVVKARQLLEKNNSHFKILTRKERESVEPGSLEDITSSALESFLMNPNYSVDRIREYDDFLYKMMLSCTERTIGKKGRADSITETLDLDEFQSRVIESMSGAVLDCEQKNSYTSAEYADLEKRYIEMRADSDSKRHFRTEAEMNGVVEVSDGGNYSQTEYLSDALNQDQHWDNYHKRIVENNKNIFMYNEGIANAEMKFWADRIDLDYISSINDDSRLSCEDKFRKITLYVQKALGVQNFDYFEQAQPIEVNWFYRKETVDKWKRRGLLKENEYDEDLLVVDGDTGAFYKSSEGSVYYQKPGPSKKKLTSWDIGTVVHEVWHAKQQDLVDTIDDGIYDVKKYLYSLNYKAYIDESIGYWMQMVEVEARAIGGTIEERIQERSRKYSFKRFAKKVLKMLTSSV